jgi:VanZ family protein
VTAGRYRGSLALWALLVAYASLYPFLPLRVPPAEAVAGFFSRPRFITEFDVVLNVLAYMPFGAIACLYFRKARGETGAIPLAALACAAFSFAMETCQLFIPGRVASIFDVLANSAGAFAGALAFTDPFYSLATRRLGELRERLVIAGAWGDTGLALVMLWLIAQLNPALPFFGAGNIPGHDAAGNELAMLQWSAVAMGICGFGLFVSALLAAEAGALRATMGLLTAALWLKFAAASFMLQPHFAEEWLSAGRVAGLIAGLVALFPLRRIGRAARVYLAIVFILAGALFSKIFGAYSGLDELLRLFRWPYGQLASFATLTRFLHELWPFLAIAFLIATFFRLRHDRIAS